MTNEITAQKFKDAVRQFTTETFDQANQIYLDKGDALWETLADVTAEQASVPIAAGGNSIAGQVNHLLYSFEIAAEFMQGRIPENIYWSKAWQTVAVDNEQWKAMQQDLRESQAKITALVDSTPDEMFGDPDVLSGGFRIVTHSAYHLGQIKHALAAQGL